MSTLKIAFLLAAVFGSSEANAQVKTFAAITSLTKLVVVADEHWDQSLNQNFPKMLDEIKSAQPRLNCVFLEESSKFQPEINLYELGKLSWSDYSHRVADESIREYQRQGNRRLPYEPDLDLVEEFFTNKSFLVDRSVQAHIRIFAIDSSLPDTIFASAEVRNKIMAKNIDSKFKEGICNLGFMPVGSLHLEGDFSLQREVSSLGISTVTYGYDRTSGPYGLIQKP